MPPPKKEGRTFSGNVALLACACLFVAGFFFGSGKNPLQWLPVPAAPQAASKASQGKVSQAALGVAQCSNTCQWARNGVCDDGSQLHVTTSERVLCDLGTDCDDCGEWKGPVSKQKWWEDGGPVAYLTHGLNVTLLTRKTLTDPPFQMLFTDPKVDLDVSEMLERTGWVEGGITAIFREVLKNKCHDTATGRRQLVLDVGANFGYFSVYAAKMGCRVIAWEPVPHFRAFLEYNLLVNNVANLVTVRDKVVTDKQGGSVLMQAPTAGVWGTASVAGINQHLSQAATDIYVDSERVDTVVDEDVLLMKVDVEGFEPLVMQSAERLLKKRTVHNLVFEYNAGVAEHAVGRDPSWQHLVIANPLMLLSLLDRGYKMGFMLDHIAKGPLYTTLPPIPEVVAARLKYDVEDAHAFVKLMLRQATGKNESLPLQCDTKKVLGPLNPEWDTCRLPEDGHPKSLRSAFPYNTNIWASKDAGLLKLQGVAGAMSVKSDARKEWFVEPEDPRLPFAMGSRSCIHLPANLLVKNRCHCRYAELQKLPAEDIAKCKAEQQLVQKLIDSGSLRFEDHEHTARPA